MKLNSLITIANIIVMLTAGSQAFAETSVVPQGVRAFVYHRVNAEVKGRMGPTGVLGTYDISERIGVSVIAQADERAASMIQQLDTLDPELLNELDLGTLDVKPDIRVKVDVFGGAFGVSKNFMLVGVVPVYSASVRMAGGYEPTESFGAVAQRLEARAIQPGAPREQLTALSQVLRQLTPPTGEHVQGVLVNQLGYKPIGHWQGQGIGDMMLYGQLKTVDNPFYKQGFKLGAEVPTGRTDDPDNLIDVAFGKGHFVSFAEALNDFYVFGDKWILALNAKYMYQWGHTPTVRLSPDSSLPLTTEKEQVYRKPGNIGVINLHSEVKLIGDLYFHSDYIYTNKAQDTFQGSKESYNYSLLERNTNQISHVGELGFSFTTAGLYTRNQFPIPFKLGTFMSRVLSGQNVDKIDMATLRFEMYF